MTWRVFRSVLATVVPLLGSVTAYGQTPGQIHYLTLPGSPPAAAAPPGFNARVRFGTPSSDGEVVALYYKRADGNTYICTGILLTRQLVLTAGHCGCGLAGSYWVDTRQDARSNNPGGLLPVAGAPILFDQRVCRSGILNGGNDLALIRLRDEISQGFLNQIDSQWQGFGYPPDLVINLRQEIVRGNQVKVVGYGYTESRSIGVRNEGRVSVYSFDCEEVQLRELCGPFSEMILADGAGNRPANDTCGGDSGGPVFSVQGSVRRLIAITSRAAPGLQQNEPLHCGGGGIYTLIGRISVHEWLKAHGADVVGSPSMDLRPRLTPDQLKRDRCLREGPDGSTAFADCMNRNQ